MATTTASQYGSSGTIEDLKSKAKQTYDDAADRAQDIAGQASEVAGNVKGAIDKSVKDQPMTTLLAAAAVGFVIGALWKS
ncbi:MAG: hypothetical protein ABWX70_00495 [Hyphomicrobium sp.]|jgi:ElaB/YqjD/DUF883 family membrane-anchored ribosome-binding protein